MKIALQYREQARRVYYGAVFEAKKEILAVTQTGKLLEERVAPTSARRFSKRKLSPSRSGLPTSAPRRDVLRLAGPAQPACRGS